MICEHVEKKCVTNTKNIATSPFWQGMYFKPWEEVNTTLDPVYRHNATNTVSILIPLDWYFVKVMVWHWLAKESVPLYICKMLRDLKSRIVK